jgi:hypothetical protein
MVRTVTVEESLLTQRHEGLQRTTKFQTGLLLAHVGSKADMLLHLVPTPVADGKEQKEGIDVDWMAQHAKQVAQMLPGGIAVYGAYVFAAGAKLSKLETALQPVLSMLSKRVNGLSSDAEGISDRQAVLLQLPSDAKKPLCRVLVHGAARLQPIELKMAREAPQLRCFASDLLLDVEVPVASGAEVYERLCGPLSDFGRSLDDCLATVDGQLPSSGLVVSQLTQGGGGRGGTPDAPHAVAFFDTSPLTATHRSAEAGQGRANEPPQATVRVSGVVHGRVFASLKEEIVNVIGGLRRDLTDTVLARVRTFLDDLREEEDEDEDDDDGGGVLDLTLPSAHALPRRAHFGVGGGLTLCDYIAAIDDEASDCSERIAALLGFDSVGREMVSDLEALVGPEACPATLSVTPPRTPSAQSAGKSAPAATPSTSRSDSAQGQTPAGGGGGGSPMLIMAALAVALLAILLGGIMVIGGGGNAPSGNGGLITEEIELQQAGAAAAVSSEQEAVAGGRAP